MGGRGSLASRNTSISSKRKNELLKNAQEYLDSGAAGGYKGYDNTAYVDSIRPRSYRV